MAKKIEWLDNFAEKYAKEMTKTASKQESSIIVDKNVVKNSKVGDLIKFKGALYKVADLEYVDEIGPGVVLMEVGNEVPTSDPMSMAMGTQVTGLENACVVEPERARTNPGDVYDLGDIRQQEVDAADVAAVETAAQIEGENAVDRTKVKEHYTVNKQIVVEPVVEEFPIEEALEMPEVTETEELSEPETETETEVELETEVVARTNRILRRIMSSKKRI